MHMSVHRGHRPLQESQDQVPVPHEDPVPAGGCGPHHRRGQTRVPGDHDT